MGERQVSGKWTTPFGPKVRYTVKFHIVGEDRDQFGGYRGADREVEVRIVTPHGESTAAALAALHVMDVQPGCLFREVTVTLVEEEFDLDPGDYRDYDSFGR
jgi:hypothetical protein